MAHALPNEPVDEVQSMSVLGAKVMHGTWADGGTAVLISAADAWDVVEADLAVEAGELPAPEEA